MVVDGIIDTAGIAKSFKEEVTEKTADFFKLTLKQKATTASRRTKIIRAHGKTYIYPKYQNTGQLARNIVVTKDGDKRIVNDGTRAGYSDGSYHGMYFLVEKAGERDVKNTIKKGQEFVTGLKLNI